MNAKYTKEGFLQTQEWLAKLEQALYDLQLKNYSPLEYKIFASGVISEIRQTRKLIDEYLGIVPIQEYHPAKQTKPAKKKEKAKSA